MSVAQRMLASRVWWDRWWCGFCYGASRMLGDSRRVAFITGRRCWKAAHSEDI